MSGRARLEDVEWWKTYVCINTINYYAYIDYSAYRINTSVIESVTATSQSFKGCSIATSILPLHEYHYCACVSTPTLLPVSLPTIVSTGYVDILGDRVP